MENDQVGGKEEVKQWTEFPELVPMEFDCLVRDYREAHRQEQEAQKAKKELGPQIEALLLVMKQKSIAVGELVAVQGNGSSPSQISAQMLASAGVDADTIAACTVPGKKYTYVQVRETKEKP